MMLRRFWILLLAGLLLLLPALALGEEPPVFTYDIQNAVAVWPNEYQPGVRPVPEIVYHNELLVKDEHYTLTHVSGNSYSLKGIGTFHGSKMLYAPMLGGSLGITPPGGMTYTGSPLIPSDQGYTIQVRDNVMPGTAIVRYIANGENGCYGMVETSFEIYAPSKTKKVGFSGSATITLDDWAQFDGSGLFECYVYKNGSQIRYLDSRYDHTVNFIASDYGTGTYTFSFYHYNFEYIVRNVNGISQYVKEKTSLASTSTLKLTVTSSSSVTAISPRSLVPQLPADVGARKTYLHVTPVPENAVIDSNLVTFTSSDPAVASVEGYGEVTIHQPGSVVITAVYNGLTATWDMTFAPLSLANAKVEAYDPTSGTCSLFYGNQLLEQGVDYQISYTEPRSGVHLVKATGIGAYADSIERAFYADTGYALGADESLTVPTPERQFDFSGTTITKYVGTQADVVVPYGVTRVEGFYNNQFIRSVTLPDTVTVLDDFAFADSTLASINLPEGLTSIGEYAFERTSLTSIVLPGSLTEIGRYMFESCQSLQSAVLSSGITETSWSMFSNCEALENVQLPDTLTELGHSTFFGCTNLGTLRLPASLRVVGGFAFGHAKRVFLNDYLYNNSDVYSAAFEDDVLYIVTPGSVTEQTLKARGVPYAKTTAPEYALLQGSDGSVTLTNIDPDVEQVVVPSTVTRIDCYLPYRANQVTLPDSIVYISYKFHNYGFYAQCGINSVTARSLSAIGCSFQPLEHPDLVMMYDNADRLHVTGFAGEPVNVAIPEGVVQVDQYAFSGCTSLISVIFPTTLECVDNGAFSGCTSMTAVNGGTKLKTINYHAFAGCNSLHSFFVHESIEFINRYAFYNCSVKLRCSIGSHAADVVSSLSESQAFFDSQYPLLGLNQSNEKLTLVCVDRSATEVTVPEVVDHIEYQAFTSCNQLERVIISEGVQSISTSAIYSCSLKPEVWMPDDLEIKGNPGDCRPICSRTGNAALQLTSKGKSFTDPQYPNLYLRAYETETGVRTYTVYDCNEDAETVVVPDGTTKIGSKAFEECANLVSLTLPQSVTTIDYNALYGCSSLTTLILGDNLEKLDTSLSYKTVPVCAAGTRTADTLSAGGYKFALPQGFDGMRFTQQRDENNRWTLTLADVDDSLTAVTSLPQNTTVIGSSAFGSSKVTQVILPEGVVEIGSTAFNGCRELTSLTLPQTLTKIGKNAFQYCEKLILEIPETVTQIDGVIGGTGGARLLAGIGSDLAARLSAMGNSFTDAAHPSLYLMYGTDGSGSTTLTVTDCAADASGELTVPAGVTHVGKSAFSYCAELDSIILPDSVTAVGVQAFYSCGALRQVTFGKGLTSIDEEAFTYCYDLEKIILPDHVHYIHTDAFYNAGGTIYCSKDSLTAETVSARRSFASDEAPGLKIRLRKNADGTKTFYAAGWISGCETIVIPDFITEIGENAFRNHAALKSIVIPETVTVIGSDAFSNCTSLESITIPSSVTKLDADTFSGWGANQAIYLPDGITTLLPYAFRFCNAPIYCNPESETAIALSLSDNSYCLKGSEEFLLRTSEAGTPYVYSYRGTSQRVVVPQGVKSIGSAFRGLTTIKEIVIPSGVTSLAAYAFRNCSELTSVTLPDTLSVIGTEAFSNCTSLQSITLPDGIRSIGSIAFNNCPAKLYCNAHSETAVTLSALTGYSIPDRDDLLLRTRKNEDGTFAPYLSKYIGSATAFVIPDFVTGIGSYAFSGNAALQSVTILENAVFIEESAFANCTALKEIHIPQSVTSVGSSAFSGCTQLAAVTFEGDGKTIGSNAFENCISLQTITIPGGTSMGSSLFKGCTALEEAVLMPGITTVPSHTFRGCSALRKVSLPQSVVSIGYEAFRECSSLKTITLPDALTTLDSNAFSQCSANYICNLGSATSVMLSSKGLFFATADSEGVLLRTRQNGDGTLVTYAYRGMTDAVRAVIPNGVTEVDAQAFTNCTQLQSVVIADTVTIIGDKAFSGCTALKEAKLPDSVVQLGGSAFAGCKALTSMNLPDGITEIPNSLFSGCTALSSVTVPASVTSIRYAAFENCTALTKLFLPDGMTSIDGTAFRYTSVVPVCAPTSQTALALSANNSFALEGYETIGLRVRKNADGTLTPYVHTCLKDAVEAVIPAGVTEIGVNAFHSCAALASVTIPQDVTIIGDNAFYGCKALQRIDLPDGITSVGSSVFNECPAVLYSTIGSQTARALGERAHVFAVNGFEALRLSVRKESDGSATTLVYSCAADAVQVTIPEGVQEIRSLAFENHTQLQSVMLPESLVLIGEKAFSGCTALKEVQFSETGVQLSSGVFSNCTSLTAIALPNGTTSVPNNLFSGCTTLTSVALPESVERIGDSAFQNCTALQVLNLPGNITYVGNGAFSGCASARVCELNSATSLALSANYSFALEGFEQLQLRSKKNSDGTFQTRVYGCRKDAAEVVIPAGVTEIGMSAFSNCIQLTSVTFTDEVTVIGYAAFNGCQALTSLVLPDGITSVDSSSFNNCPAVLYSTIGSQTSVTLAGKYYSFTIAGYEQLQLRARRESNGGVTTYVHDCSTEAADVIIPAGVTEIGPEAFRSCEKLVSVTLPENVTKIGSYAFYGCSSLAEINLPESVNTIQERAFYGCAALKKLELPGGITYLGINVFMNCPAVLYCSMASQTAATLSGQSCSFAVEGYEQLQLRARKENDGTIVPYVYRGSADAASITIPQGVKEIGAEAFRNNASLTAIEIPEGVVSIGNYAFQNCTELASITLPSTLQTIGTSAFYSCTSLQSLPLPDGIVKVGNDAFNSCPAIRRCGLQSDTALALGMCNSRYAFEAPNHPGLQFRVTKDAAGERVATLMSVDHSLTEAIIPDGVTVIASNALKNHTALVSITLPEGLITIGDSAFYGCSSIVEVVLPQSVSSIENTAFAYCKLLERVVLPAQLAVVPRDLFYYCSSLKEVTIPDGVTQIGQSAFSYCSALAQVTLPQNLTSIENSAFQYCTSLKAIAIPEAVTRISQSAFSYCSALEQIALPQNLTSIENSAFNNCTSLKNITIPDAVIRIGQSAFSYCSVLEQIALPQNLTSLGSYAFQSCIKLTSVAIPDGVAEIGNYTFANCTALEEIRLPAQLQAIGSNAFYQCQNLASVDLPASVTAIGSYAFYSCDSLTSIIIPDGVTGLGERVFSFAGLKQVVLPKSLSIIGKNAFYYCSDLTALNLPSGVTVIDEGAFYGCSGIKHLQLPEALTAIGKQAFYNMPLQTLIVPENVTSIGEQAFSKPLNLLYLPSGLQTIAANAFTSVTTVYGYSETAAQRWAQANSFPFVAVDVAAPESYLTIAGAQQLYMDAGMLVDVFDIAFGVSEIAAPEERNLSVSPALPNRAYTVVLSSANPAVAVIENGKIRAAAPGETTVTASIAEVPSVQLAIAVKVYEPLVDFTVPQYIFTGAYSTKYVKPADLSPANGCPKFVFEYVGNYGRTQMTAVLEEVSCVYSSHGVYPVKVTSLSGVSRTTQIVCYQNVTGAAFRPLAMSIGDVCTPQATLWLDGSPYEEVPLISRLQSADTSVVRVVNSLQLEAVGSGLVTVNAVMKDGSSYPFQVLVDPANALRMPASLAVIEEEAFSGLPMSAAAIPDHCTQIGAFAFANCAQLTYVRIPAAVSSIGSNAFAGCEQLTIYAPRGSYASTYAAENGIPVIEY